MDTAMNCLAVDVIKKLEAHFEWQDLDERGRGYECGLRVGAKEAPFVTIFASYLDPKRRPIQFLTLQAGKDVATTLITGQDYERDIRAEANVPFGVIVAALAAAFKGQCGPISVWVALTEADHRYDGTYGHGPVGPRLAGLPSNFEIRDCLSI